MYLPTKVPLKKKDQQRTYLMMFIRFFLIFFIKAYVVSTQVDAIQVGTTNICLCKIVDKIALDLIWRLLDCELIGVCAVIRSNMVCCGYASQEPQGTSNENSQYMFDTVAVLIWYY